MEPLTNDELSVISIGLNIVNTNRQNTITELWD